MAPADNPRLFSCTTRSVAQTQRVAASLAPVVCAGDLIALVGPLGCGKTRFVQGLVAALPGSANVSVTSPTFTTVNTYPTEPPTYHMDLYRLPAELDPDQLGYEEYYEGDGLCVVEWFDRVMALAPDDYLSIEFSLRAARTRRLICRASGPRSIRLLDRLRGHAAC